MELDDASSNDSNVSNNSNGGQLDNSVIKAKILSGDFKVSNKRGRSQVWQVFGKVENSWGEEIKKMVYCRTCSNVYKFNRNTTSNLVKHKCYILSKLNNRAAAPKVEVDSIEVKKNGVRAITEWFIEDCRSFKIIEDSGLKAFAEFLIFVGAKYGENVDVEKLLPHASIISKNVEQLYDLYFVKIKDEINLIKDIGFGLTPAVWTDNYFRTFMSLSIHYVQGGLLVNRLLGIKLLENEKCTIENIELKVCKLLNDFDCEFSGKATIITDRDINMDGAFRSCNHIYCINHLLHDALEKSTKEVPGIAELYSMCTEMVQYLLEMGIGVTLETTLKTFFFNRWNKVYYLFDAISKNWDEIINILEHENESQRIKKLNLNYITSLANFLQSFEETSRKLEADYNVTLHLVYAHIHRLKKICIINTGDLEIVKHLKEKLNACLETQVLPNITVYHKMALFLFPPANKLIPFSESDKKLVKDECKRIMISYLGEISDDVKVHNISTSTTSSVSLSNTDLFNDFVQPTENTTAYSDVRAESEILMYQSTNVTFHDDFNILQWWHLHQGEFPLLYKLSCQILATPANCVVSERIISAAKNLISEKGIEPNLINQIMFLHSNISKNDISVELEKEILMK